MEENMTKVAINGMGRIGRAALKVILEQPELELVAVNDIGSIENIAYLLKYDTVYGRYQKEVSVDGSNLVVDGKKIPYLSERDPADLPWAELDVKLAFECVGIFTKFEDASKHIHAGAEWVIISGPTKSKEVPTVVHAVNDPGEEARVISCASCTTNNITPVVEILGRRIGIKKAMLTTIHGYTSTQSLVDGPKSRFRRGRAAAVNIVPTTTGAAVATTKALPQYEGVFDGISVRVPVPVGSISDITFVTERDTTVEEINSVLTEEAQTERYQEIFTVTNDEIVSSDIIQDSHASIADLSMTRVVDGDLVKVMTWYDNEWGYTNQMIRQALEVLGLQ
jgi:glyceraldehyde 3-phosphate dehydrogenase